MKLAWSRISAAMGAPTENRRTSSVMFAWSRALCSRMLSGWDSPANPILLEGDAEIRLFNDFFLA